MQAVETRVIKVLTAYADFDDFWESNHVPIGSFGTAVVGLPPADKKRLKARLREQLPTAADGSIVHEAFANAVKGRVPG